MSIEVKKDERRMVRFLKHCSPYRSGERAKFPPAAAAKLVATKQAVYDDEVAVAKEETELEEIETNGDDQSNDGNNADAGQDEASAEKRSKKSKGKSGDKSAKKRKRVKAD